MSNLPIEYCGIVMDGALSWNGFNLVGDQKSIKELKRLMHEEACAIDLRRRVKEMEARRTVSGQEAVGVVGTMPGTEGFTMACFEADHVPVGTKLYAAPLAQSAEQDVPMDPRLNPHGIVASPASGASK